MGRKADLYIGGKGREGMGGMGGGRKEERGKKEERRKEEGKKKEEGNGRVLAALGGKEGKERGAR